MKLIQHISAVDVILRKSSMSKDSRISFPFLIDRWNSYRASHIRESYDANMEYDTSLFQNLGTIAVTERSLQDDPTLPGNSVNIGKVTIPAIVSMVNNAGLVSVSGAGMGRKYNQCHITELADRMTAENYKNEWWFAKVGNTLFLTPFTSYINVVAILDNPLDGWVMNTEKPVSGSLVYTTDYQLGESYVVKSGTIIHDGVTYTVNQAFTATKPTFTGNGVLDFVMRKRKMTINDSYPMSATMAEMVMMKILTQDFKLEKQEIADVRNNMKDEAVAP